MKILRVKLRPPGFHSDLTQRPRLEHRLDEAVHARVSLLMAPAGFGKSSLMVQWYRRLQDLGYSPRWLTIDKTIGEAVDILGYLIAALHVDETQPAPGEAAYTGGLASADYLLDLLLETLESVASPTYFFLDDFHLLSDGAVSAVGRLIEQAPGNTHFIIASRTQPELPLARARTLGELLELDAQELKFSLGETRLFLNHNLASPLGDEITKTLLERTEGWIAALKLATLAMRRGVTPEKLLSTVNGRNRTIADYFNEEVLSPQNSAIRDFMLKTCILERFCPELCNAVTGQDMAREMIDEVESKGLFLFQLDEERHWYRYHHLLAKYLSRLLGENDPELLYQLHRRASKWFWAEGYFSEAMEHALQSGDMHYAAELLEESSLGFTYSGNIRQVARFSARIPDLIINRQPRILLTLSWFHTRGMRFERSQEILDTARECIEQLESSGSLGATQLRELRYLLLHRQMLLTSARDDVITLEKQCRQLLDDFPEMEHPYMVGTTYCHLLLSRREQYKLDDLEQLWLAVKGVESRSPYSMLVPALRADLGPSLYFAGKTTSARQALEEGLQKAIEFSGPRSALASLPALPLAEMAYERNDLEQAEKLISDALPSARKLGYIDQLMPGVLTLARLHRARGNTQEAFQALDEGMVIALDRQLERFRLGLIDERVKYLFQDGRTEEGMNYAKNAGISLNETPPLPETGVTTRQELLASIWVRIAIATLNIRQGLDVAKHWRVFCAKRGAVRSLIRWNLLHAQLHFLDGQENEAQRPLREALTRASDADFKRSFLDEGPLIRALLQKAYSPEPVTDDSVEQFASELLQFFEGNSPIVDTDEEDVNGTVVEGLHENLTNNELKILGMAAHGLRNREIASKLGMTEGSIKWYMQQIYDKLGTRPRTRAIDKARKLGLIQ
jgi:LuxR family maltose regulon positive regulatory protein